MSSDKRKKNDCPDFAVRLTELCGTSQPAKIQRLLGISDQAARNYLDGRLPDTHILIRISERTGCSIDWLLTGKKFVEADGAKGTPILARQLEESVRRICVEVINELDGRQTAAQPKAVVLQSGELLSEKIIEEESIVVSDEHA